MKIEDFKVMLKGEILAKMKSSLSIWGSSEATISENAFTEYVGEVFEASDYLDKFEACYFYKELKVGTAKCNGYSFDQDTNTLKVFVVDFDQSEEINSMDLERLKKFLNMSLRFISAVQSDVFEKFEPSSAEFLTVRDIRALLCDVRFIRIIVLTNRILSSRTPPEKMKFEVKNLKVSVNVEVADLGRIKDCALASVSQQDIVLNLNSYGGLNVATYFINEVSTSALAVIPGEALASLYKEYGERLLEGNVRSYLQAKGKVNKGILETLEQEPDKFFIYNNGLTIVCKKMIFDLKGKLMAIVEPQIVNGGQTTASLFRAIENDLKPVMVQCKIIQVDSVDDHQLVRNISRFSNTQNKISDTDLLANEQFLVMLEKSSRKFMASKVGKFCYFERSRGAYFSEIMRMNLADQREFEKRFPKNLKYSKEEVGLAFNSWAKKPFWVSRGGQKNFSEFARSYLGNIKDYELGVDSYKTEIGKIVFYREVRDIVKSRKDIEAYRNNVTTYSIAVAVGIGIVNKDDLSRMFDAQALSESMTEKLFELVGRVNEHMLKIVGARNASEVFKKEETWKSLSREFDIEETGLLDVIVSLSYSQLREINEWLESNEDFDFRDRKVLIAFMAYQAQGWDSEESAGRPTANQIVRFERIYNSFLSLR
ncbi:AIPR family protein [Bdellovibrio sp. HCB274]|uniref:AIPR family protein n=1 Tax=Bdellovibrio sp. HCB274 TaxID=3394361 RepID=UPI0039B61578